MPQGVMNVGNLVEVASFPLRSSSHIWNVFLPRPMEREILMFSPALLIGFVGFFLYVALDISLHRVVDGSV